MNFPIFASWSMSMTYGELVMKFPAIAEEIVNHEWDNMTPSEQRDHVIGKLTAVKKALAAEEESHEITMRQRDFAEGWADKLASGVGDIDVIGEHSNLNNPWETAWDMMRSHAEFERLEKRVAALDEFLKYAGVAERYPFNRLVQLLDEQGQKCSNQDDRDYWRFVKEKLLACV